MADIRLFVLCGIGSNLLMETVSGGRGLGAMKVLFIWTGVASYMADCWRVLANSESVELKVVIAD